MDYLAWFLAGLNLWQNLFGIGCSVIAAVVLVVVLKSRPLRGIPKYVKITIGAIAGIGLALVAALLSLNILMDIARENSPCCKSIVRIDASEVSDVDSILLVLCGRKTTLERVLSPKGYTMEVFTGENSKIVTAQFTWEEEIGWDFRDEPCEVIISGLTEKGWKVLGRVEGFEMRSAIRAGVSMGFKLKEDGSEPALLYWP